MSSNSLRKPDGTFAPGWKGGGRPPGARAKLSELALRALGDDFRVHGPSVIEKVRQENPTDYLRIVASLCPRELHVERRSPFAELSDDELRLLEEHLNAARAQLVIELEPEKS